MGPWAKANYCRAVTKSPRGTDTFRELQLIVAKEIPGAITASSITDRKVTMRLKTKKIKGDTVKNIKLQLASRAIFHRWLGGGGGGSLQGREFVCDRDGSLFVRVSRIILAGVRNFGRFFGGVVNRTQLFGTLLTALHTI